MPTDHTPELLECLSERVLRNLSPDVWRDIFTRPNQAIQLQSVRCTVLYALLQVPGWGAATSPDAEIAALADSLGGDVDPCPGGAVMVSFRDPVAALAMALEMNGIAAGCRFQIGIASGDAIAAHVTAGGLPLRILLGDAVQMAEAHCHLAPAGTIRISGETAPVYQRAIGALARCVVTTELEGSATTAVNLTLAPPVGADLSTFAGLGLT